MNYQERVKNIIQEVRIQPGEILTKAALAYKLNLKYPKAVSTSWQSQLTFYEKGVHQPRATTLLMIYHVFDLESHKTPREWIQYILKNTPEVKYRMDFARTLYSIFPERKVVSWKNILAWQARLPKLKKKERLNGPQIGVSLGPTADMFLMLLDAHYIVCKRHHQKVHKVICGLLGK